VELEEGIQEDSAVLYQDLFSVILIHVFREANMLADSLANESCRMQAYIMDSHFSALP
jgi:hypothetical protein